MSIRVCQKCGNEETVCPCIFPKFEPIEHRPDEPQDLSPRAADDRGTGETMDFLDRQAGVAHKYVCNGE